MSTVKLWLTFHDSERLALSIPLAECATFSVNPLKWLRFIGYTIYGREGYLCTSATGPQINDYTAHIEARSYYFISEHEPRLVDVGVMDDRTSNSSDVNERTADFRQRLIDRDGSCVLIAEAAHICTACHIIPHSKGDKYISNLFHLRRGSDDPVDDFDDIDDTRNGILLASLFRLPFGTGQLAFLKTPNFAMTVDDVPYNPPRQDNPAPTSRLTLHHFVDASVLGRIVSTVAPHNTDARQPQDTAEWPPAIIVDLCYGAAALDAWAPKSFIDYVWNISRHAYYDNAEDDAAGDEPGYSEAPRSKHYSPNRMKGRLVDRSRQPRDEMMSTVLGLWMHSSKRDLKKSRALDLARNDDKVQGWLKSAKG